VPAPSSLRTPFVVSSIFATVMQWIYKGKLRTVRTPGGHHRILEEDIEKHLRSKLPTESSKK
jgi:excisionase family DNA binding protein